MDVEVMPDDFDAQPATQRPAHLGPAAHRRPGSGTRSHMAPELFRGRENASPASDTYALGVIAYECLAGRNPFDASSDKEWCEAHRSAPLPPLGGSATPAVYDALRCALAKRPEERPSAREFAKALRAALDADLLRLDRLSNGTVDLIRISRPPRATSVSCARPASSTVAAKVPGSTTGSPSRSMPRWPRHLPCVRPSWRAEIDAARGQTLRSGRPRNAGLERARRCNEAIAGRGDFTGSPLAFVGVPGATAREFTVDGPTFAEAREKGEGSGARLASLCEADNR